MCLLSVYGFCAVHYTLGDFFGVNGLSAVDILGGKRDFMWLTSRYRLYQPFDSCSVCRTYNTIWLTAETGTRKPPKLFSHGLLTGTTVNAC